MNLTPDTKQHHTATPYLIVANAARAIEFYKNGFGAEESMRVADESGLVVHAEIVLGDSTIMLADEAPQWGRYSPTRVNGSPVHINLYVEDSDAFVKRAVDAGAEVRIPVADQFYGDRAGRISDPFGHVWIVSTRKEDVPLDEMQRRLAAYMQNDGKGVQG